MYNLVNDFAPVLVHVSGCSSSGIKLEVQGAVKRGLMVAEAEAVDLTRRLAPLDQRNRYGQIEPLWPGAAGISRYKTPASQWMVG